MTDLALPYGRQWIDDDDVSAVVDCLRDPFLTQGPRVAQFEQALCQATGAAHACAVTSGTAALHVGALALGLGPGDVGLTSPITFLASANAVLYAGARVAFADVDPATGLLDPETAERAIVALQRDGRHVSLIIPVDLAGQPVDLPGFADVARRHGARVLHDAAHSLGAEFEVDGQRLQIAQGDLADATVLSFHPVKHITTAEGGAVLCSRADIHSRAADLRNHGMHKRVDEFSRAAEDPFVGPWYYEQSVLGFNYRISDLQCALGLSQLRRLQAFVQRRQQLAARYDRAFREEPFAGQLAPLSHRAGAHSSYHLYVVRLLPRDGEPLEELAARRKRLYLRLHAESILVQVHYIPVPWQPRHRDSMLPPGGLPGAELFYAGCLSLPMFPAMKDSDVDRVVEAVQRFVQDEA